MLKTKLVSTADIIESHRQSLKSRKKAPSRRGAARQTEAGASQPKPSGSVAPATDAPQTDWIATEWSATTIDITKAS